jgi:lysophospholipase L1-like esterase
LAALAVVEIVAAVYVVRSRDDSSTAAATPHTTPVATSSAPAPSLGIDGSSTSRPETGPLIAFLGDDWTRGAGASAPDNRFTTRVCAALGARELNSGVDGTGYAKPGERGGPYATRVAKLVADHPDVVVVSGGRNDSNDNPATARDEINALFAKLHRKLPDAVLVAVAPFWGDSDLPDEMVQLGTAIEDGITAVGGTYLDIEDPIHDHPRFMADLADPNDAGYAAIAAALTPELEGLLPE